MARRRRRPKRRHACDGKKKYTQEGAESSAAGMRRSLGALVRAYKCPHKCKRPDDSVAWHVGHIFPR